MTLPAPVTDLTRARAARAERAETVVRVDPDPHAQAGCALPGCGADLHITWTASRAVFLGDTVDDLAAGEHHTATWEVSCDAGHILLLPPDTAADSYIFGECDCDGDEDFFGDCGHNDMARLRRVVA
jgi:hypothetical protein